MGQLISYLSYGLILSYHVEYMKRDGKKLLRPPQFPLKAKSSKYNMGIWSESQKLNSIQESKSTQADAVASKKNFTDEIKPNDRCSFHSLDLKYIVNNENQVRRQSLPNVYMDPDELERNCAIWEKELNEWSLSATLTEALGTSIEEISYVSLKENSQLHSVEVNNATKSNLTIPKSVNLGIPDKLGGAESYNGDSCMNGGENNHKDEKCAMSDLDKLVPQD